MTTLQQAVAVGQEGSDIVKKGWRRAGGSDPIPGKGIPAYKAGSSYQLDALRNLLGLLNCPELIPRGRPVPEIILQHIGFPHPHQGRQIARPMTKLLLMELQQFSQ